MILSAMALMLIIDTLKGSLEIRNGYGRLFNFTDEDREKVKDYLVKVMNETLIEVSKTE